MEQARVSLKDLLPMPASAGTMTAQGYLAVPARISRDGIQEYLAIEFGSLFKDREWDDIIKVYRPSEEVFAPESLASFNRLPVTDDHPFEDVTATNWKEYAVGQTEGAARQDGNYVKTGLLITDAGAVNAVQRGKRELSCGYTFDGILEPGVTENGEAYDMIARNIRGNHVAIVDSARCGPACRAGDAAKSPTLREKLKDSCKCAFAHQTTEDDPMTVQTQTRTIDGIPVVMDAAGLAVFDKQQSEMDKLKDENEALKKELADMKAQNSKDKEEADKAAGAKDAEIASLKKAADTQPDIDDLVAKRQALLDTAKRHLPADYEFKGKDAATIKRAVAATRVGDDALKDATDAYVDGMFTLIAEDKQANPILTPDPFVPSGQHKIDDHRNNGYDARDAALTNAWKN